MAGFVIQAVGVLDGILAIAPLPGAAGDYAGDLEHLKDWRPAMVITLTTQAEMHAAGADDLGHDIADLGTRWVHVPIVDFGVPDIAATAVWAGVAPVALAALRGGGRVLIHCRGGCGRSGMVALRLMIAAGEAPDHALARLRARTPGAVETKAQMRWAMQGHPCGDG